MTSLSLPLTESNPIYLYLTEEIQPDLAKQLKILGHQVKKYDNLTQLAHAIKQTPPTLLILGDRFLVETENLINSLTPHPPSCIFLAQNDSFETRIQAIRMGGMAFFVAPIDVLELSKKIDALCGKEILDPYRVLLIEDSTLIADCNAGILEGAGIKTEIVNNPLKIMPKLVDFKPDLILMDLYMPKCNGLELATLLRQQPAYTSIPLIFLSAEEDKAKQLAALSLGADDFIIKGVSPEHLIANIKLRIERARILRSYMVKDSLTDLFNHAALREKLIIEIERAKRRHSTLTFIMIDLDNFKSVNDTYGHTQGDKILREIANLLQHRLRKTDIAARYGGEEFAVILPDTPPAQAQIIIDEIRNRFANLQHRLNRQYYNVTFSAGIAAYPQHQTQEDLINAADKALYRAKHSGKNRLVFDH